tara:strand:+ start:239 stop:760 length:522 start_codon:yes stop_codon:yes gene_type:complete
MNVAIFGAGCFWCVEAIFSQLNGIYDVTSGYCNGTTINPTYESVCSGNTGHAEVCKVSFNPDIISFEELLNIFFQAHDPTTLNRQGADEGTQYRSGIFYVDDNQKSIAENFIKNLINEEIFKNPIVTEITKLDKFYKAENYHQNYYENNKNAPYCRVVIKPKLDKFFNKKNNK